jgi:hypothetical protein
MARWRAVPMRKTELQIQKQHPKKKIRSNDEDRVTNPDAAICKVSFDTVLGLF